MTKHDQRYAKTQERLQAVYLNLLMVKKREDITVKEICYEANCSRNTFYLHFDTKDDIFKALIGQVLNNVAACFDLKPGNFKEDADRLSWVYVTSVIEGISPYKQHIQALAGNDYGQFFQAFAQVIYDRCAEGATIILGGQLSVGKRLQLTYLANALTGFIFDWLNHPQLTDEEAKKILFQVHQQTMAVCSTADDD